VLAFIGSKFQQQAMKIKCMRCASLLHSNGSPFCAVCIQIGIQREREREKEPFSVDGANKNGSKAVLAGAPQFAQ